MKIDQRLWRFLALTCLSFLVFRPDSLLADYTIVLENGLRITVKDYWEENGMIKFRALTGELGLAREQIRSIEDAKNTIAEGFILAEMEKAWAEEEAQQHRALAPQAAAGNGVDVEKEGAPYRRMEKLLAAEKEKGYQEIYEVLVGDVKSRTDLHWLLTRGTSSPDPVLLSTLEAIDGRINDINSRIKDAMHNPARRMGTVKLLTNSTFSGQYQSVELGPNGLVSPGSVDAQPFNAPTVDIPNPGYSAAEAELSVLRRQLEQLYEERKRLLEAFKQENLFTGSLPYEAFP